MDFKDFCIKVSKPGKGQRKGQYLFNTLYTERPDLAEKIRATETDPFYDDAKVHVCLKWLKENW